MKKISLLLGLCMLVFITAQGQDKNFGKGSSALNIGIGFGNTIYQSYEMGFPSFSASYEYGIVEIGMGSDLKGIISVGGIAGYGGAKKDYGWWTAKNFFFLLAGRANYHFIFHDQFDPYAGVLLGYYFGNTNTEITGVPPPGYENWMSDENTNGFHGGAYVGARWFFTPSIAAFAEVGWSISIFTTGVTFKF